MTVTPKTCPICVQRNSAVVDDQSGAARERNTFARATEARGAPRELLPFELIERRASPRILAGSDDTAHESATCR